MGITRMIGLGALSAISLFAIDSMADPVDNTNPFTTWNVDMGNGHSQVDFDFGHQFLLFDSGSDGSFTGTYDNAGNFTGDGFTTASPVTDVIPTVGFGVNHLVASLNVSSVTGTIYAVTGKDVTFTFNVRVTFATKPANVLGTCFTTASGVTVSSTKAGWSGQTASPYDATTGQSKILAHDFSFSAFAPTACAGNGAALNAALGLGTTQGGILFDRDVIDSSGVFPQGS